MLIFFPHSWKPNTKVNVRLTASVFLVFFFQVLGNWSPVFLSGDSAHPLWEHPRTGPQAATILSELCGDHAQRSRRGEDWDPRVSTPISREEVELHNCQ